MIKIASWNVNSLRVRLPQVLTWLQDKQPDVLALQELKMQDGDFPFDAIAEAGYFAAVSGQKTYNGVAFLSREKSSDVVVDMPQFPDVQRRVLAVTIGNIRLLNLYVPNGESVTSEKYHYKLNWLKHLTVFLKQELQAHHNVIVVGDFNIAPAPIDVHDPKQWEGRVLFSEPERLAFQTVLQLGFSDCFREHHATEKQYTWWDYRVNAFKRNLGLRIDHILASHKLSASCIACDIDKTPRTWERPSDHTPIMAVFDT